jgi:HicB family
VADESPRIATAIRLSADLHARLKQAAEDRDVSVNWLITRAVTDLLDRLPPVEDCLGVSPVRVGRRRVPSRAGENTGGSGYYKLTEEEFDQLLRERYGDSIAAVAALNTPTQNTDRGGPRGHRRVVGNPENPDADPSAVDGRHHQARVEHGR